jgi:hypothetical protein
VGHLLEQVAKLSLLGIPAVTRGRRRR